MNIKDYEIQELTLKCVELVSKTLVELGQVKDEEHIVILAQSLSNDLKEDFKNLEFEDIIHAFRQGVRNTDRFVLNVQTYYSWIKEHRQLIWNESSKEPERKDKRLIYRSKSGTGLLSISDNIKKLK